MLTLAISKKYNITEEYNAYSIPLVRIGGIYLTYSHMIFIVPMIGLPLMTIDAYLAEILLLSTAIFPTY